MTIVAKWSLNGGLSDSSGNGNTLTNSGVTFVEGVSGQAGNFNNSSFLATPNMGGRTNFSFSFIINTNTSDFDYIYSMGRHSTNITNTGFVFISNGLIAFQDFNGSTFGFNGNSGTGTINDGKWNIVTVIKNYPNMYFFINGNLSNTITGSNNITYSSANPNYIGYQQRTNDNYFTGKLDELELNSTAISMANAKNKAAFYKGFI